MISKLNLAKLRQFKGGDLVEWMQTQFRQNMLAIEKALQELANPTNYLSCQLSSITVPNNDTSFFTFAYYVRTSNNNQDGKGGYKCKSKGNYLMTLNLTGCYIDGSGGRNVYAYIYKNNTALTAAPILLTNSTNVFNLSFSWILELQLETDDVLTFAVSNLGPGPADVTANYGYLEIKQLTQG